MRSSRLKQTDLFRLYGLSVAVLLPFAMAYAYAINHGFNRNVSLGICLVFGVIATLIAWGWNEEKLSTHSTIVMNFDTEVSATATTFTTSALISTPVSGSAVVRKGIATPSEQAA